MEPWIWAIVGVVPALAVGTAYAMGAFSTDIEGLNKKLGPYASVKGSEGMKQEIAQEKTAFRGDVDDYGTAGGKRKRKTKKAKKSHKKTIRRK